MNRWYAHVPKGEAANRQFRIDVMRQAVGSRSTRQWLRDCCRDDTLFYFNTFLWTYDPRLGSGNKSLPFITYEDQDPVILEIEACIEKGRDALCEKSRDRGATWIMMGVCEKRWHFHRDESFMCISRDTDEVDKPGYPDCLFWKIDFIHKSLPAWLMPKGFKARDHRRRMVFENPETGSTINGEATVSGAGVGGRKTAMMFDEFARIEEAYQMLLGTADVSPCRIFNSTPYGTGNAFYELVRREHIKKLVLHWSGDPRKNNKMYRWNAENQGFDYFKYECGQGIPVQIEERFIRLVPTVPHQWGPEDADGVNFDPPRPFEPVRDGILRSPVYDIEDTRRGNRQAMAINWDISYGGSDYGFFDKKLLLELSEFCVSPFWEGDLEVDLTTGELLSLVPEEGGPLRFWCEVGANCELPASKLGYGCGSDLSRGQGASNSCASFVDVETGHKICEYVRPDEKPEKFAAKVVALCRSFVSRGGMQTLLAWEKLGPGEVFKDIVMELGYSNVYYHGSEANKQFMRDRKPGWPPNPAKNLDELLSEYQVALRQRRFTNYSAPALGELERFMQTPQGVKYVTAVGGRGAFGNEDPSGAREGHGDRGIADALANRAIRTLGGGLSELAKQKTQEPEFHIGTLAGRMRMHELATDSEEGGWR